MRDVILAIRYNKSIVTYNISEICFATVPPALVTKFSNIKRLGGETGGKRGPKKTNFYLIDCVIIIIKC
jgi:hypothetical protein